MTEWKEEISSVEMRELQVIAEDVYMQRRNIRQEQVTSADGEPYSQWRSESREISANEYRMLKSIEEIDTRQAIDDYTMQLIEEGVL